MNYKIGLIKLQSFKTTHRLQNLQKSKPYDYGQEESRRLCGKEILKVLAGFFNFGFADMPRTPVIG